MLGRERLRSRDLGLGHCLSGLAGGLASAADFLEAALKNGVDVARDLGR